MNRTMVRSGCVSGLVVLLALACGRDTVSVDFETTLREPQEVIATVDEEFTTSERRVVANVTIPRTPQDTVWLLIVQGQLGADSEKFSSARLTLVIDGVERSFAETDTATSESPGPVFLLELLEDGSQPREVEVRLGSPDRGLARVRRLQVIAFPLPSTAIAGYSAQEDLLRVSRDEPSIVQSLALNEAEDVIVLGTAVANELPGRASVFLRLSPPADGFELRTSFPIYSSVLFVRRIPGEEGNTVAELTARAGPESVEGGEVRSARILALRSSAFSSVQFEDIRGVVTTESPQVIGTLTLPVGAASRWLTVQTLNGRSPCTMQEVQDLLKRVTFVAGDAIDNYEHDSNTCLTDQSYAFFSTLPGEREIELRNEAVKGEFRRSVLLGLGR